MDRVLADPGSAEAERDQEYHAVRAMAGQEPLPQVEKALQLFWEKYGGHDPDRLKRWIQAEKRRIEKERKADEIAQSNQEKQETWTQAATRRFQLPFVIVIDAISIIGIGLFGLTLVALGIVDILHGKNIDPLRQLAAYSCEISAANAPVDLRESPNMDSNIVQQLSPGPSIEAVGRYRDQNGYTWFQLSSGPWVRNDAVSADTNCSFLPLVSLN